MRSILIRSTLNCFKMFERRVAGPEIVERADDTKLCELVDRRRDGVHRLTDEGGLEDLDLQPVGRQLVVPQQRRDPCDEVGAV